MNPSWIDAYRPRCSPIAAPSEATVRAMLRAVAPSPRESAGAYTPSTNTSVVHSSSQGARAFTRSGETLPGSTSCEYANVERASGPTLVYFHLSLPRVCVGNPTSAKRSHAALRSSRSHPGWPSPSRPRKSSL